MHGIKRLIHEIHRRSIWQVLGIYLVSGWVAYQVVESLTDGLGLPDWFPAAALLILIAGLPIVLATAFVQAPPAAAPAASEGPDSGAVLPVQVAEGSARRLLTWRNTLFAGLGSAGFLTLVVGAWIVLAGDPPAGEGGIVTAAPGDEGAMDPARIAVLYFDDLSRDGDLGYLADGFTEALIHELSQVERLSVISRNGVRPYRGTDVPLDSIARALSVGTLVEGSVEQSGDLLRATVQLIDGATETHLMSTRLERAGDDVLVLRDNIVQEAAVLLRRRLGEEIRLRERRRDAENAEAWSLVQRAGELVADAEELKGEGAVDAALRTLVEADSVLAVAERMAPRWPVPVVRRGRLAFPRAAWSEATDLTLLDSARVRAERALELAPGDAEALWLRGAERFMRMVLHGTAGAADGGANHPDTMAKWANEAERAFRASLAADPERAETWAALSEVLTSVGRFAEAQQAAERAYAVDPFLANAEGILLLLCNTALERGDAADIDRHCAEAYRRFPQNSIVVYLQLWVPAVLAGVQGRGIDIDSLWRVVDTHLATLPDRERDSWRSSDQMVMAGLIAQAGLPDSARAVRRRARAGSEASAEAGDAAYMLRYAEAYALLRLGQPDSAIATLRGLLEDRPVAREYLKHDRAWEELWDDPAFKELVGES